MWLARFLLAFVPGLLCGSMPAQQGRASASVADPDKTYVSVDAPSFVRSTDAATDAAVRSKWVAREEAESTLANGCESGEMSGKPCRVNWRGVLGQSLLFLVTQHSGNLIMDKDTRRQVAAGSFWGNYAFCVEHYRWSRWKDDDPFAVDYIGHPMMGSLVSFIYEQNDPKQRALSFKNSRRYWMGRLRAMAFSAAYSAQWKVGPLSEASIGNTGIGYYRRDSDGLWTNETGMQDFFITPVGGLAWNTGEDLMDRAVFRRLARAYPRNRTMLFFASVLTPTRSAANLARFRAPYYRDRDSKPGPH